MWYFSLMWLCRQAAWIPRPPLLNSLLAPLCISPRSGSNSSLTSFLMKWHMCCNVRTWSLSLMSATAPFHLSISWSGSPNTIRRRSSLALTPAQWWRPCMIAKQLMMSSENSLRACLLFLEILLPLANLFTTALTMTLGWTTLWHTWYPLIPGPRWIVQLHPLDTFWAESFACHLWGAPCHVYVFWTFLWSLCMTEHRHCIKEAVLKGCPS